MSNRLPRPRMLLPIVLLALAVAVTGCFGGRKASTPSGEQQATAPPTAPAAPSAPQEATTPAPAPAPSAPSAPSAPEAQPASGEAIVVVATDEAGRFRFEPDRIEVRAGQAVTLKVVNKGPSPHDLSLRDLGVETGQFNPGEERTLSFTAPTKPGEYRFVCTVPGHEQLGMTGTLVVR